MTVSVESEIFFEVHKNYIKGISHLITITDYVNEFDDEFGVRYIEKTVDHKSLAHIIKHNFKHYAKNTKESEKFSKDMVTENFHHAVYILV